MKTKTNNLVKGLLIVVAFMWACSNPEEVAPKPDAVITIADQSFSVDENSASGAVVGTVVATVENAGGESIEFSISAGNTGNAFSISGNTGSITVNNSAELDFETTPEFTLTVVASLGSKSANAAITISLNDLEENLPEVSLADEGFAVDENSANGSIVGTITAATMNAGTETTAYAITAGNTSDAFAINSISGEITVSNSSALDFETTPNFSLTITATLGNLSDAATVTITLNDVDENVTIPIENEPAAQQADDNKSSGVYKGAFVGSTGIFKLVIQADGISGVIEVDGINYSLTTQDLTTGTLGAAITNAVFSDATGTVNLTFSVDADGQNPTVSLTITGHDNIQATIAKETSDNQIKVYTGKMYYSSSDGAGNEYQCIYTINMTLDTETTMPYKYDSFNTFEGTANCDTQESDIIGPYVTTINGNQIEMYQWVSECEACPPFQEGFLDGTGIGQYSENEIFFESETWTSPSGRVLQDSARFIRSL